MLVYALPVKDCACSMWGFKKRRTNYNNVVYFVTSGCPKALYEQWKCCCYTISYSHKVQFDAEQIIWFGFLCWAINLVKETLETCSGPQSGFQKQKGRVLRGTVAWRRYGRNQTCSSVPDSSPRFLWSAMSFCHMVKLLLSQRRGCIWT